MRAKIELSDWIKTARLRLTDLSETSALETELLLMHVLEKNRAWIATHPETGLEAETVDQLDQMLERLVDGEPLPYLLGHWEFFGLDFCITPAVLIPRPETEMVVETALAWLQTHPVSRRAVDVGTGSGCIAISLAKNLPNICLIATDISFKALQIAQINKKRLLANSSLQLIQADLLKPLPGPFDLIVANLPYIPEKKLAGLKVFEHEPRLALDGGQNGIDLITTLLFQSASRLAAPGCILLEIEFEQGDLVSSIASQIIPQASIEILPDLAGLPRMIKIETYEN
ncbi:MAG: peptide chain release factor N(5)-glutamine methyltransferase [Anaerolineaceae bacterium]|nr:peptide chain release factor N(5)-glutamine methyltransferase [Anaerolineaceae bacterium]